MASYRQEKLRDIALAKTSRLTLDQLHKQLTEGEIKEVPLILKCDVQGSQEALTDMLNKLSTDKVKVRVLHSSVGVITETDVLLAAASSAIIIGFNVRSGKQPNWRIARRLIFGFTRSSTTWLTRSNARCRACLNRSSRKHISALPKCETRSVFRKWALLPVRTSLMERSRELPKSVCCAITL